MGSHFFDYNDSDYICSISKNMAIGSDGSVMMRLSDNMAMDMDSGELHFFLG